MGRKEIKTKNYREEKNKPKEVEQVTNRSPVGAVDIFWVHLYSLSSGTTSTHHLTRQA